MCTLQVCSVLESLDREYRRDEDWCNTDKAAAIEDKVACIQQFINKHQEQKEAFLKVHIHSCLLYCAAFELCRDFVLCTNRTVGSEFVKLLV